VSEGCRFCYAERQAGRFSGPGQPYEGLVRKTSQGYHWTGEVRLIEKDLEVPLHWKKPRRIFVNSMSDLWHESVPDEWIDRIFAVMALAPQHTFQILTKRPERMHTYCTQDLLPGRMAGAKLLSRFMYDGLPYTGVMDMPLKNVWVGVSCENQTTVDERLPWLLQTPATVRFVSYEPALGPANLTPYLGYMPDTIAGQFLPEELALAQGVDWVIVGGESGPHARPCDVAWIRGIIHQCQEAEVPCFVKQLGARPFAGTCTCGKTRTVNCWSCGGYLCLKDRKGADPAEWPADLLVQQFPLEER
jgi:protein gp37